MTTFFSTHINHCHRDLRTPSSVFQRAFSFSHCSSHRYQSTLWKFFLPFSHRARKWVQNRWKHSYYTLCSTSHCPVLYLHELFAKCAFGLEFPWDLFQNLCFLGAGNTISKTMLYLRKGWYRNLKNLTLSPQFSMLRTT